MTLIVLSQGLFSLPWDPSRAELFDTSSAALTRRCRRLNWSGFVSSRLSHDPLLYGSVKGACVCGCGGNPPEYAALMQLLFALCRPTERMLDWSYFMLGLTLSSTLLHHISCSLLCLLFPPFYHHAAPRIPPFLKPLMQHAQRAASVTPWNDCDFYRPSCSRRGVLLPSGAEFHLKAASFCPKERWWCFQMRIVFSMCGEIAYFFYLFCPELLQLYLLNTAMFQMPAACCAKWIWKSKVQRRRGVENLENVKFPFWELHLVSMYLYVVSCGSAAVFMPVCLVAVFRSRASL